MPKPSRPPSQSDVTPGESSFRWFVRSRSGDGKHLVDLESYEGAGRCTCKDYQVNLEPVLRRGMKPEEAFTMGLLNKDSEGRPKLRWYQADPSLATDCYHIFRARLALSFAFTQRLIEANKAARR